MRNISVHRSRLLTTNSIDEGVVGIYAGFIARRIKGIHRTVVADVREIMRPWQDDAGDIWMGGRKKCNAKDFSHIILEGNHRAIAQGLFSEKIPSTLLENDADLEEFKRLSEAGDACRFTHDEAHLDAIVTNGFHQAFGHDGPESVLKVIRYQFSEIQWPKFIREKLNLPE